MVIGFVHNARVFTIRCGFLLLLLSCRHNFCRTYVREFLVLCFFVQFFAIITICDKVFICLLFFFFRSNCLLFRSNVRNCPTNSTAFKTFKFNKKSQEITFEMYSWDLHSAIYFRIHDMKCKMICKESKKKIE